MITMTVNQIISTLVLCMIEQKERAEVDSHNTWKKKYEYQIQKNTKQDVDSIK